MIKKMLLLFFVTVMFFTACNGNKGNSPSGFIEKNNLYMGTVITQRLYGPNAEEAADKAAQKFESIENMMTINTAGGEINKLNSEAGKSEVSLSAETIYVLGKAKRYSQLSNGVFDPTIGPLVKVWGIGTENQRVPLSSEINGLLELVDYKKLHIDEKKNTARLEKEGQIADVGGIAKGYAGDEAIKIYKSMGIKSAYVNLGGNVVALGSKPDGTPWRIGIQNPRDINGKYIGIVGVINKSVVTSGDYERYFEKNGQRYHHIIDPRTGYPSDSGIISATIIADMSIEADALSTSVFILGLDKGMALVNSIEGVDAIIITKDKKIYATDGIRDNFRLEDDINEYEYVQKR